MLAIRFSIQILRGISAVTSDVLVVIGAGAIGQAIARRTGVGKQILLADINTDSLAATADLMEASGYNVRTQPVDVAARESVRELAAVAADLGPVTGVVHTAGLSPVQAPVEALLRVDLVGVALVLQEFGRVIAPGGSGVVISSMAGHMIPALAPEQDEALARTAADELMQLPFLQGLPNSGAAYTISKRANALRVQAAAVEWGDRGARINSISPGIIFTPLAMDELNSAGGPRYREMMKVSAAGRGGTPDEVGAAAAYLMGPDGAFITGSDLLIDGGVIAAMRAGRL
jgi:NAD(P)-dependent dehydrogenase (short-subunit alcohol dehydrogenase family)